MQASQGQVTLADWDWWPCRTDRNTTWGRGRCRRTQPQARNAKDRGQHPRLGKGTEEPPPAPSRSQPRPRLPTPQTSSLQSRGRAGPTVPGPFLELCGGSPGTISGSHAALRAPGLRAGPRWGRLTFCARCWSRSQMHSLLMLACPVLIPATRLSISSCQGHGPPGWQPVAGHHTTLLLPRETRPSVGRSTAADAQTMQPRSCQAEQALPM